LKPVEVTGAPPFKLDNVAPVATSAEIERYDAIVVGTGTSVECRGRWQHSSTKQAVCGHVGALNGKVGAAFSSTGTQHSIQDGCFSGRWACTPLSGANDYGLLLSSSSAGVTPFDNIL
jgi:hypothetical protein